MSVSTKGFTLIELLVVIAILAVLSTISINSYSGYIESSAQKAAENSLRAMSIAQQEYKSNNGSYFPTSGATGTCAPTTATTANIITTLFGGIDNLTSQRYNFCTTGNSASYTLVAKHKTATCQLSLTNFNILTPSGCDV